ncbi:MAG: ABC transporter ATP-binding protein [Actinomycetota bacterium]
MSLSVDVRVRREGFALDAAFEARAGETLALLGPNGAGKSTLVSILSGLLRPDEGRVVLHDAVLDEADRHVPAERRPVGVVFQDLLLFPHLSAAENVAFGLRARGTPRDAARERARRELHALGVDHRADAAPATLSGGEAQRVALARALAIEPALLLLDEPLSALDVGARGHIRELVASTLEGFDGVGVLVTHDPVEAMTLADRLVLLEDGRVTQVGTPEEVRDTPTTVYAADLVGVNLYRGRLEPLGGGDGRLIVAADGELIVTWPEGMDEGTPTEAAAVIRPADVVLHAAPPEGSSRNVLHGPVAAIAEEGARARVRLATSPPIVAEVTHDSVRRLHLAPGIEVWASVKAVEIRVVPV